MQAAVSMGKSIWVVDSEKLEEGVFIGVEMVSDITQEGSQGNNGVAKGEKK